MVENEYQIKDLLTHLDAIASFSQAEGWDNVGLMVGKPEQKVKGILVALDPTEDLLAEAIDLNANTIVTHHPLIFHPLKSIRTDHPTGRFLETAILKNISVIGCHTNLDVVSGGVNDVFAASLGLSDIRPLESKTSNDGNHEITGFGRIGHLQPPEKIELFLRKMCEVLKLDVVKYAGILPDQVETVAVCGGSGSEFSEAAFAAGAQIYITGEIKHSTARWAEACGFCLIDAGHFSSENVIVPVLADKLRGLINIQGRSITVSCSSLQKGPFQYSFVNSLNI